jgi:hypothetical protein
MILLPPFIMITLVAVIFYSPSSTANYFLKPPAAVAADPPPSKEICTKTTLYTLTFHPQKEKTILCHPDTATEKKLNDYNILFNKGLVAGQHSPLIKCPSSDKSFCDGWEYAKKYLR